MNIQSIKKSLSRSLRGFVHSLFHNSSNPAVQGRDHNHLESEYRRTLSSPLGAAALLGKWIFEDEHVLQVLQENPAHQPQLMRVAVVGDEIRINLFRLERFPGGPLMPAYNDNWQKDGIIDFVTAWDVSARSKVADLTVQRQTYQHLVREFRKDLSYDIFEPYASLTLPLVAEEMAEIDAVTVPSWKRCN